MSSWLMSDFTSAGQFSGNLSMEKDLDPKEEIFVYVA